MTPIEIELHNFNLTPHFFDSITNTVANAMG